MKHSIFIILSFIFFSDLSANILLPQINAPLIEHLKEVNKEWAKIDFPKSQRLVAFKTEIDRLQEHLRLVDSMLSKVEVGDLLVSQKLNRKLRLKEFRSYWQEGQFPMNTFHFQRQPYFVDINNTACAVGHLMRESGATNVVARISKENNYAYIEDLVKYPSLITWAKENGFSIEELAWIQPSYPPLEQVTYPVGNGGGANGPINVMYSNTSTAPIGVVMAGDFTEIDGVAANSIVTWDGEEWHTHGEGIDGRINAVTMLFGRLVVGGKFTLSGMTEEVNIARWENDMWHPLQIGDMEGEVFALHGYGQSLYVGGNFHKVNGTAMSFLVRYILQDNLWSQTGKVNDETVSNILTVDGPVKTFDQNLNKILVGGSFTKTAIGASHPDIEPIETQYLAYWEANQRNWIDVSFSGDYQPALAAKIYNGWLVVGGDFNQPNPLSYLDAGIWSYGFDYLPMYDGLIHGFLEHNDKLVAYGGFSFDPVLGINSYSIDELFFQGNYGEQIGFIVDNTVTAAASYKGEAYFAGDFLTVNNQSYNGLFRSPLDGTTSTLNIEREKAQVYQSNGQLFLKRVNPSSEASVELYNMQGELVYVERIPEGTMEVQYPINHLNSGVYVFQLKEENQVSTGKIFK